VVRQCDLDAAAEAPFPDSDAHRSIGIHSSAANAEQKAFEARLARFSEKHAKGRV